MRRYYLTKIKKSKFLCAQCQEEKLNRSARSKNLAYKPIQTRSRMTIKTREIANLNVSPISNDSNDDTMEMPIEVYAESRNKIATKNPEKIMQEFCAKWNYYIMKMKEYFIGLEIFNISDLSIFQIDTGYLTGAKFGLSLVNGDRIYPLIHIKANTKLRKVIVRGLEMAAEELHKEYVVVKDGSEIQTKNQLVGQVGSAKYFVRKLLEGCVYQFGETLCRVKRSHLKTLNSINSMISCDSGFTNFNFHHVTEYLKEYSDYGDHFEWKIVSETDWNSGYSSEITSFFDDLLQYTMLSIENLTVSETSIEKVKKIENHFNTILIHKGVAATGCDPTYIASVRDTPKRLLQLMKSYGPTLHMRNYNLFQQEVFLKAFLILTNNVTNINVINHLPVICERNYLITNVSKLNFTTGEIH